MNDRLTAEITQPHMRAHSIHMDERARMSVTGVSDVESFNEQEVCLSTLAGLLHIDGSGLHITKLSLDEGHVLLEGDILALEYEPLPTERRGLFSRVFR